MAGPTDDTRASGTAPSRRATRAKVAALVLQSGGAVQPASALPQPRTALSAPAESAGRATVLAARAASAASPTDSTPTTATRLRRLVDTTPRRLRSVGSAAHVDDAVVAQLLGGTVYDDGVVVVDRVVPRRPRHVEAKNYAALARRGTVVRPDVHEDLVYLDTETTGLAGGTGTVVFILGLARERGSVIEVRQFVLTAFAGEHALLAGASEWLATATGLVTYNGLSFDVPLLNTRFRLAELPREHADAMSALPHLDLLHPMRAAFGATWPNCTLQTAERQLLGHVRVDDLPGSMVPMVFTDLVRYGRTAQLRSAVDHNSDDLVSLAALVDILSGVYAGNGRGDAGGIARRLVRLREHEKAQQILASNAGQLNEKDTALLLVLNRRFERLAARERRALERQQRAAARDTVDS